MNLTELEKSILPTLVYYHAIGDDEFPLTSFEIYCRLTRHGEHGIPSYREILAGVDSLKRRGTLVSQNGFFYLSSSPAKRHAISKRIRRYKIGIGKTRRLERALTFLGVLPFIKMIGITGSLSLHNADVQSDIDLFIITQPGRIWTSRILCSLATHILGMRRYRDKIQDRICLSHYITSDALALRVQNLSNAHTYANLIPVWDEGDWYRAFRENNSWMNAYLACNTRSLERCSLYRRKAFPSRFISAFVGLFFAPKIGDFLERFFQYLQEGKILKQVSEIRSIHPVRGRECVHSRSTSNGVHESHLVLSRNVLMFHYPVSRNQEIERRYKEGVEKLGIT